ncbi:MAG: hypothetical protein KDE15_08090 [Erythrobacter sp.]|nr:hypothetical protein [Erythrobacter sp.]
MNDHAPTARRVLPAMLAGLSLGMLAGGMALLAAFVSAGAGHGDYVAARLLFPYSMLLTLVEGRIGAVSLAIGLAQFPAYGALLGWLRARRNPAAALALAGLHLVAAMACFTGILPNFS